MSAGTKEKSKPAIRIGISSCLLGEEVRFDGGHKHDSLITGLLGNFFTWVPVCPEVEIGLGTPRESLRLVGISSHPQLIAPKSGADHTAAMHRYARRRAEELAGMDLHGYILKKDSPSCGMERVRVYDQHGSPRRDGRGLFAAALMERLPQLPVEEEGRLHDVPLRENFIERVYARHRWLAFLAAHPTAADLIAFHARQKYALLAHHEQIFRRMGRLVAHAGRAARKGMLAGYGGLLFQALAAKATPRKHANVLQHLAGFLKDALDPGDRAELAECIDTYRMGRVPLIVPITLLRHHFRRHPHPWVMDQVYLNPYPDELMLRNHV